MEFALFSMASTVTVPFQYLLPPTFDKWKPSTSRIMASRLQSSHTPLSQKTPSPISELDLKSTRRLLNGMDAVEGEKIKKKTVFIMGTTATGKSRLAVDLATNIDAEIINSDKLQVYKGLGILTNIIREEERKGIPHHLLAFMDPDSDFTVHDFCTHVHKTIVQIVHENGRVPIIVGGSNNYIKELVENPSYNFRNNFESLFLWIDADVDVLYKRVEKRVDEMVEAGLVEEVRAMVKPGSDHTRGVWRVIGVSEMDLFLYAEKSNADEMTRKMLVERAISRMKENTCRLVDVQLGKIKSMINELGWKIHRIDATIAMENSGGSKANDEAWNTLVVEPSLDIVNDFLRA